MIVQSRASDVERRGKSGESVGKCGKVWGIHRSDRLIDRYSASSMYGYDTVALVQMIGNVPTGLKDYT